MSLERIFGACTPTLSTQGKDGLPPLIQLNKNDVFSKTSFFVDSSGHSSFILPLELRVKSKAHLAILLESRAIVPAPSSPTPADEEAEQLQSKDLAAEPPADHVIEGENSVIGFEAISTNKAVVVESVSVLSTSIKGLVISFEAEVTVRASESTNSPGQSNDDKEKNNLSILATLEISPVLTINDDKKTEESLATNSGLLALEMGAIPDQMQHGSHSFTKHIRLEPLVLLVTLAFAFTISVKSVSGSVPGNTIISLTITHSNTHREPVTVHNIAVHPGSSRYEVAGSDRKAFGGKYSVANMCSAVQWSYIPQTELQLPLMLHPNEGYSTALMISGSEEMRSRTFMSPVSVTGSVGLMRAGSKPLHNRVVVAATAQWTTELVAVEPANAFRIEMKLSNSNFHLGEQFVVSLRIFNLSLEARNLMLFLAKQGKEMTTEKEKAVNSAVVSEASGYTFGIWGISTQDDGTILLNRDQSILAVDGALQLGEILGQHATDAELRFVPLRQGPIKIPNLRLYDKVSGNWYSCEHMLQVVVP